MEDRQANVAVRETATLDVDRFQLFDERIAQHLQLIRRISVDLDVTWKRSSGRHERNHKHRGRRKPQKGVSRHDDAGPPESGLRAHRHPEVHLDNVAQIHRLATSALSRSAT